MKRSVVFLFLFCSVWMSAQNFSWWNEKHDWDGTTHWSRYLILSPAYMGPNALPVPEAKNGLLSQYAKFELAFDQHFSSGDRTNNLYTELYIPLYKERVGMSLNVVPVEYYDMDTMTRDIRRARDFDGEGRSVGDVYINTYIQLAKDHASLPDLLLSVNLKTASGSKLSAARHTDSPGYYFDLSFGRTIRIHQGWFESFRPYGMLGFYAWQTNRTDYYQNDAYMYGVGCLVKVSNFNLDQYLGGYSGYIGNGDRPVVYRASLRTDRDALLNYAIRFQAGLRDFEYNSLRLGFELNLEELIKDTASE